MDDLVRTLDLGECPTCKEIYSDHPEKCRQASWDVQFSNGCWHFNLSRHGYDIWSIGREGSIVNILLAAIEGLASGEWKEKYNPREILKKMGVSES